MPPPPRLKYQTSAPLKLTPPLPRPATPITSLNIRRVYKQENQFLLPLNLLILRLQLFNYTNTYVCKM